MDEKQLQKAVEKVRREGYLDITIRINPKSFAEINDHYELAKHIASDPGQLLADEGRSIFGLAFTILKAYKKKYGGK